MRKIFTSISMALCLLASTLTASAQATQLSEAQKEEVKKKVLPVVFDQIKQQTGLDILGWARPQLTTEFVQSLPFFNPQMGLRADEGKTPYKVKPEKITVNLEALGVNMPMMKEVLVTFENYKEIAVPLDEMVGRAVKIELPSVLNISAGQIPVGSVTIDAKFVEDTAIGTILVSMNSPLLQIESAPLVAITISADDIFHVKLELKDALRTLLKMFDSEDELKDDSSEEEQPIDFQVDVDLTKMMAGTLHCQLWGIPTAAPTMQIPMGIADVQVDLMGLMGGQGGFPLQSIALTSFDKGQVKGGRKLWFSQQKTGSDNIITIDDYRFAPNVWTDSTYAGAIIVTMSDLRSIASTETKAVVKSVVERVVNELATSGKATWYKMVVEKGVDMNADEKIGEGDIKAPLLEVEVTPYLEGTKAIADVNVKSYEYDDDATKADQPKVTEMTLKATADLAGSEQILVEVIPAGSPIAVATATFNSNIAGIITHNADITLPELKVTPVEGGIYVENGEKAAYRIVNMGGTTVASGTVAGNHAYIPTDGLAKGVYVLVVTENGGSRAVKFAR